MHNETVIGIRYCGGCNPRYDRVAVVKKLASLLPEVSFVNAEPGVPYAAVLAVHGCPTRCALTEDLAVPAGKLLTLSGWSDLLPLRDAIRALGTEEKRTLTAEEVKALLPHRPPMLFVDAVEALVPGKELVAHFTVKAELPELAGHFPGAPVFPGTHTLEAMAQAADLMLLSLADYQGKVPLLAGVKNARFKQKISPGDTVELHASLLEERRDFGWVTCRCQAFVKNALAADAEIQLALR